MAHIVFNGTFICLVQGVLVSWYLLGLRTLSFVVVVKVREELPWSDVPQLIVLEHVRLYLVHAILGIRILLDIVCVFL